MVGLRVCNRPGLRRASLVTCVPVFGPRITGKLQFSGAAIRGRWMGKDNVAIEVYGGADCSRALDGGLRAPLGILPIQRSPWMRVITAASRENAMGEFRWHR
jgi:hypothetical protein